MRYRVLSRTAAIAALAALRRGEAVNEEVSSEARGEGRDVASLIPELAAELDRIRAKYPPALKKRDPAGGQFEAGACVALHRVIPTEPDMLGDYGFWTWLAVFHFRDLVEWRHGGASGQAALANYGIGNGAENVLYRMWLRADTGFDPGAKDPYHLTRRGDQDFWRSHVLRPGYGRCRGLVRELIRFQFPDASAGTGVLKVAELRELAKRISRLQPTTIFDVLSQDAARDLIAREADLARVAVRSVAAAE